jgi:membrane-associated phospholipid phosphatase
MKGMLGKVNAVKRIYEQYLRIELGFKFFLSMIIVLESLFFLLVNELGNQYQGVSYFNLELIKYVPIMLVLYGIALFIKKEIPRVSLFFQTFWTIYIITLLLELFCTAIQFTPFPSTDIWFYRLDQSLGFNVAALMDWTLNHYALWSFFQHIYNSLVYELLFAPLLLALLLEYKQLEIFFITCLLSALIGFTFYYFFPTSDPAAVIKDNHFLTMQWDVVHRFIAMHQHQPIYSSVGGLVGFPSFHVIWATAFIYAFKTRKYLFYLALVYNVLIILSTLFLGWHFLMDDFGGLFIVLLSIVIAEYSLHKVPTGAISLSSSMTSYKI